jgi:DNA-binding transcriptional LysR family regulator
VDVSIVHAFSLPNSGNVSRVVGEIEHVLVALPRYIKACRIETFDQLTEHALTAVPAYASLQQRHAGLGVAKPALTVGKAPLFIDNLEATRFAVLAGAGVAALPLHFVRDDIQRGLLVQLFPEHRPQRTQVFALYASRRHVDAKIRTFIDFLASHFATVLHVNPWRGTAITDDGSSHSSSPASRFEMI